MPILPVYYFFIKVQGLARSEGSARVGVGDEKYLNRSTNYPSKPLNEYFHCVYELLPTFNVLCLLVRRVIECFFFGNTGLHLFIAM